MQYPTRETQMELCRWGFVISYILIGAMLSWILIQVTPDQTKWVGNVVVDVLLVTVFVVYCRSIHQKAVSSSLSILIHVQIVICFCSCVIRISTNRSGSLQSESVFSCFRVSLVRFWAH